MIQSPSVLIWFRDLKSLWCWVLNVFPGYCFSYCKLLCKFNHRARRTHFVHIQTGIVSRTCILLLFFKTLMANLEYPYGLLILYSLSQWILSRFQDIVVLLILKMKTQDKRIFRSFSVIFFLHVILVEPHPSSVGSISGPF